MKIILFSSHTATWFFAFAEAVVASALQKRGHNVVFVTPGQLFTGVSDLRQETILREEFSLKGYTLGDELEEKDFVEINHLMNKLNRKNFDKLVIDSINIGKTSLYELLLNRKKMHMNFTDDEWRENMAQVKNTLISLYACRKIIKKENPDRILMYNTLYSVNHVWEKYARQKKVPVYFLHHGVNLSDIDNTLMVAKHNTFFLIDKLRKHWLKLKNIPINKNMQDYVTDHFLQLFKAKHYLIYSAPKSNTQINIRKIFGIKENQKILTATMSSYDEMFAAQYVGVREIPKMLIFSNQVDWIKSLVDYVGAKPDLFLIVRVHPREFPNKRDGIKSDHAKMLETVFKNLPSNVKINWPTDTISIFDIAKETDIFLNAWSTVGVEMSLLGIPVVAYSKDLVTYPSDLNYFANDKKDYYLKIEQALERGWNYERIKKTYRWLALCYCRTIFRFRPKTVLSNNASFYDKLLKVANYIFVSFSPSIRGYIVKFILILPGLGINKIQRDECRKQLSENVDISRVEDLLVHSKDSLVDTPYKFGKKVTNKEEDIIIRNQVRKIYKLLYTTTEITEIKNRSLQWNLKKIIT